jgi:basic amino acid/polyamine antiporter, APA family
VGNLQRNIGLFGAVSIIIGSVIGSGIFMKPATIASQVGSPFWIIMVWLVAGVMSIMGALINAEIGTMFPESGGQLVYFKKMYGERFAFIYGWASFSVINTASVAAIAYVCSTYMAYFFEPFRFSKELENSLAIFLPGIGKFYILENFGLKLITASIVIALSVANYISVKASEYFQNFFTILKVGLLLIMVVAIFGSNKGSYHNFQSEIQIESLWIGFIMALSGAFAAFDGWNNLSFISGEMKNTNKNIPLALIIGLTTCLVLYLLTNLAYIYMLPTQEMAKSDMIATDSITPAFGQTGAVIIAALVVISTLGATNGNIMACSRVTYAIGKEGDSFHWLGKEHLQFKTPGNAILLHCIWSCGFVFTGSFDLLSDLFVFVTWIFYGFAAYGIFILRKKLPNQQRPFKIPLYPIMPVLFVTMAFLYASLSIYSDVMSYLSGHSPIIKTSLSVFILFLGFLLWEIKKKRQSR